MQEGPVRVHVQPHAAVPAELQPLPAGVPAPDHVGAQASLLEERSAQHVRAAVAGVRHQGRLAPSHPDREVQGLHPRQLDHDREDRTQILLRRALHLGPAFRGVRRQRGQAAEVCPQALHATAPEADADQRQMGLPAPARAFHLL